MIHMFGWSTLVHKYTSNTERISFPIIKTVFPSLMYFPDWCISQSDVFPSLMYFPVWCISQSDVFLSLIYFLVWPNCISSEVRADIHQWACSIKRLGWWLQSGPPSSCQCRGCQGPGLLGGRTPVSPAESLLHPEHNQPTGGSGKSTWNKWKGPQIPLRANTTWNEA